MQRTVCAGCLLLLVGCGSDAGDSGGSAGSGGTAGASGAGATAGTSGGSGTAGASGNAGSSATDCASGRYVDEIFAELETTSDVVYGNATTFDGQPIDLLLDLYQPKNDGEPARAAIVWVHGGGFIGGDKQHAAIVELASRYARRGYVTVSIDYRLVTATQMQTNPAAAILDAEHDARAAVRWLRENATTHRIDPARIAIGGGSAGAVTSLYVAYDESEGDSGHPGFSSDVRAVVDFWGALFDESILEAGEAPVIVIHGTADNTVPFTEAEELVARANAVGVPVDFHPLSGVGHAAWGAMDQYVAWITPFVCKHVIQ